MTTEGRRAARVVNPLLALRSATSEAHRRLDDGLVVTDPDLTEDAYLAFLVRLFGIVAPLEDHIAAHAPLGDWDHRRRAWMLRHDLGDLADTVTYCEATPTFDGPDQALGAVYVLEGSTLGGVHVAAMVRQRLGADTPLRWFESYGDQVPIRWQAFRRALHRHVEAGGDLGAMVAGANATFDAMSTWLLEEPV